VRFDKQPLILNSERPLRALLKAHGLTVQEYLGRKHDWSWFASIKQQPKKMRRKSPGLAWHCWYTNISMCLAFDFRFNRWGLQLEHWYRLTAALRKPTYHWLGSGRDLDKLLTNAIPEALQAHQRLIEPLLLQDAEERLTGRASRRGCVYVGDFLRGVGINDPEAFLEGKEHRAFLALYSEARLAEVGGR
jgi:hypothetical protein